MQWRHLVLRAEDWNRAPALCVIDDATVFVCFEGGSTTMLVAAAANLWTGPVSIWLRVTPEYPSTLIARDLGTLSWLVDLSHVVLTSDDGVINQHADVAAALLSGDDVTLSNDSARLEHAWNRPLPPREISLWVCDDRPQEAAVTLRAAYVGARRVADPGASAVSYRLDAPEVG